MRGRWLFLLLFTSAVSEAATSSIEGTWSTTMTTPNDEAWAIEEFGCFLGCPVVMVETLRALLADPANDEKPFRALFGEALEVTVEHFLGLLTPAGEVLRDEIGFGDEASIACKPPGLVRGILNPLPVRFSFGENTVTLTYEAYNSVREIGLNATIAADAEPVRLGHSTARYEGATLVIETTSITPNEYWIPHGAGGHGAQLRSVERYSVSEDGRWLRLQLSLIDPVNLKAPFEYEKRWLSTPDVELLPYKCELISGQK